MPTIEEVVWTAYSVSVEGLKAKDAREQVPPLLSQYRFNPPTDHPLIRTPDGRFPEPVPQLINRKLSPGGAPRFK